MRYMIAQQMRMAAQIIRVELKSWQQVGRFEFIDDDGERVRVISGRRDEILALRFDRIYLAYGWWDAVGGRAGEEDIYASARAKNARVTYVERNGEMHDG